MEWAIAGAWRTARRARSGSRTGRARTGTAGRSAPASRPGPGGTCQVVMSAGGRSQGDRLQEDVGDVGRVVRGEHAAARDRRDLLQLGLANVGTDAERDHLDRPQI